MNTNRVEHKPVEIPINADDDNWFYHQQQLNSSQTGMDKFKLIFNEINYISC